MGFGIEDGSFPLAGLSHQAQVLRLNAESLIIPYLRHVRGTRSLVFKTTLKTRDHLPVSDWDERPRKRA